MMSLIQVYWTEPEWRIFAQPTFETVEAAIEYGKAAGREFRVYRDREVVTTWEPE